MSSAVDQAVDQAAARLAEDLTIDEDRDTVRWRDSDGRHVDTGLHDYAALYAVQGLYEAVYVLRLGGRAPQLLADVLAEVVPPADRSAAAVLDVAAGTGCVGAALHAVGFARIAGTDIEPASIAAIRRDRDELYSDLRLVDLVAPTAADDAWLRGLAPDVVTVSGAVGFGHLPVAALSVLTELLGPGALLALTVARGYERMPELAGYAALLGGPAYRERARRDGLHRRTSSGAALEVTALVLERIPHPADTRSPQPASS